MNAFLSMCVKYFMHMFFIYEIGHIQKGLTLAKQEFKP